MDAAGQRCPVCEKGALERRFDARGLAPEDPRFFLARCAACGYGATLPAPAKDEIGRWYPLAYYGDRNVRFNPVFEWLTRWFRRRRARVIAAKAAPGPMVDVGCGRGLVPGFLRELGFEPHGVEVAEVAAYQARTLGIPVHVGDFVDAPYAPGRFVAITFWHSLEHLAEPRKALERARELLTPGGLLAIAVPNSDSLQARLFGANWFHLDVPRHYHHFGARSLRLLLEKLGFRVVQEDHFSAEQNPYGWLQSALNALGFEFNLLYSALKAPGARMLSLHRHPLQALLMALLVPPLLLLSGALTLVEAVLRRGGTVEIYALKGEAQPSASPSSSPSAG